MDPIRFEVKMTKEAMTNFVMYHNYASIKGWGGVVISLMALVYLVLGYKQMENMTIFVLIVIALLFTVINPLMLRSKAAKQVQKNETFKEPLVYELEDKVFRVVQNEEKAEVAWEEVVKVKDSGKSIIVYFTAMRAFIWPKEALGSHYDQVVAMIRKKVDARKVKIKES